MNIKEAKVQIKNTVRAYLHKIVQEAKRACLDFMMCPLCQIVIATLYSTV